MKGRITKYFEEKGYGFIQDENGESRFFHISKVKGTNEIMRGRLVEFAPEESNKGLSALDIRILSDKNPVFIALDEIRIKLNNIKNYGIDYETINEEVSRETVYYSKGKKFLNRSLGVAATIIGAASDGGAGASVGMRLVDWGDSYDKIQKQDIRYKVLYITTYQGDNFRFHEKYTNFNIDEKIEELDNYFCD